MGRLIDDLRAGDWLPVVNLRGSRQEILDRANYQRRLCQRLIDKVPVIVADEVAAYVYSQEEPLSFREWDWAKDFPNTAPPFGQFFIEWHRPTTILRSRESWNQPGYEIEDVILKRNGVLFMAAKRETAKECPLDGLTDQSVDYEHWMTCIAFGETPHEGNAEVGIVGGLLIDRHGQVVGKPMVSDNNKGLVDEMKRKGWGSIFRTIIGPALLAITFMHCKSGAHLEEVVPPERLNRARVRRGKKPLVRHHTLVIDGLKELLRREGGIEQHGLKRALHLCRGHFATYSAEKPLLGHFVGTVFRSAHMRGHKKHGVVTKDYEVKGPGVDEGQSDEA
jgi:hypothetical protein